MLLGSGGYPLPAAQDFSKPLWIGVKIDSGEELRPLSQLTGAPFAFSIPDSSVTKDKMGTDYVGSITVNGQQITGKGTTLNLADGLGIALLYNDTTNSLSLNAINGINNPLAAVVGCTLPWQTTGNISDLDLTNPAQSCSNIFGFSGTPPDDILMENNGIVQMTMLGVSGAGNGLMFPSSLNTGVGVIWQNANTYIHSFGGVTNFFAGNQAGNLSMASTACSSGGGVTNTYNTGVGYQALTSLAGTDCFNAGTESQPAWQPEGAENTALGSQALQNLQTGWENTATGYQAMQFHQSGYMNTASGYWALWKNVDGYLNAAFGACALENNLHGSGNTAVGWGAMSDGVGTVLNPSSWNTASGEDALTGNTGTFNSAFGAGALSGSGSSVTGWENNAFGAGALVHNTSGERNTGVGCFALDTNQTGIENTAIGYMSLFNNTVDANTAAGAFALYGNTTGYDNTASGFSALFTNQTGTDNTASGYEALYWATGSDNTADGSQALYSNTSGYFNTASGFQVLNSNTTGESNTASGFQALTLNSMGYENTAIGAWALLYNMIGNDNTASGESALQGTTGSNNTAFGAYSGQSNTTGSTNTFVGYYADAGSAALTDATAIGSNAVVAQSNTIQLGDANVQAVIVPVGTTAQRPASPIIGMIRFNTTLGQFEGCDAAGHWHQW